MKKALIAPLALALLTSCNHKELCFNHEEHALTSRLNLTAVYEHKWEYTYTDGTDWQANWQADFPYAYDDLLPSDPEGLRVLIYDNGGQTYTQQYNLNPYGGEIRLAEGDHAMLLYNNDTEYIVFNEITSYAEATATTRARARSSYYGSPFSDSREDENTVSPPDMLYGHYIDNYTAVPALTNASLDVTMHPLVYTYLIIYKFEKGLQHVALARGALSGMARAVYLNSGRTGTEEATLLYDCEIFDGYGVAVPVKSFGIPDFPNPYYTRTGHTYGLNLEVKLTNGKTKVFDFDVTDQVAAQPHGGVIIVEGLVITDEESGGASAFDISVTDWGPDQDVDMDF